MKLFIHIGAHKTGTTSIQRAMEMSGEALAGAGFIYPRCCWYHHGQHRLAFALKNMRDRAQGDAPVFETELAALNLALAEAEAPSALISSEEFFALTDEAVARLAVGLKDHEVEIIAFVRRPDELFLSAYNQKIKQTGNRFYKPIERHLDNPAALIADIEYFDHIGKWAARFGRGNIHLAVYEGGDAVDTLCAILKLDASRLSRPEFASNPSVSGKALEFMRLVKSLDANAGVQKAMFMLAAQAFPASAGAGRLPAHVRRDILKRYAEKNDALFRLLEAGDNPYDPERIALAEEGPMESLGKRDLALLIVKLMGEG
ncbi:MAG: hypothetical protein ACT4SY_04095 [Hyphomicrobiales bacterium]